MENGLTLFLFAMHPEKLLVAGSMYLSRKVFENSER